MEIKFQYAMSTLADIMKAKGNSSEATPPPPPSFALILFNDVCVEKAEPTWKMFTKLRRLYFSTNAKEYSCYWETVAEYMKALETIFLEIPSPISWTIYQNFVEGCEGSLVSVTLENVEHYCSENKALDIDLGKFYQCKRLENLVLLQSKHPSMSNSKLIHVSKLPRSLRYIEFSWLQLTPCQVFRLVRYPLEALRLSYWSSSDENFGRLLCYLKWAYCLGCVGQMEFIITDLKIRFQRNKKTLEGILKHKNMHAEYIDFNNTQLILTKK